MNRPIRHGAVVAAVAALALGGCGGSGDDGDRTAQSGGVKLTAPSGWHVQDGGSRGVVVAREESDLTSEIPSGPRLAAQPAGGSLPALGDLIGEGSAAQGAAVVNAPTRTTVGGKAAISVVVRETRSGKPIVTGLVVVALGPGRAVAFTSEVPAAQWPSARPKLNEIAAGASFG